MGWIAVIVVIFILLAMAGGLVYAYYALVLGKPLLKWGQKKDPQGNNPTSSSNDNNSSPSTLRVAATKYYQSGKPFYCKGNDVLGIIAADKNPDTSICSKYCYSPSDSSPSDSSPSDSSPSDSSPSECHPTLCANFTRSVVESQTPGRKKSCDQLINSIGANYSAQIYYIKDIKKLPMTDVHPCSPDKQREMRKAFCGLT